MSDQSTTNQSTPNQSLAVDAYIHCFKPDFVYVREELPKILGVQSIDSLDIDNILQFKDSSRCKLANLFIEGNKHLLKFEKQAYAELQACFKWNDCEKSIDEKYHFTFSELKTRMVKQFELNNITELDELAQWFIKCSDDFLLYIDIDLFFGVDNKPRVFKCNVFFSSTKSEVQLESYDEIIEFKN